MIRLLNSQSTRLLFCDSEFLVCGDECKHSAECIVQETGVDAICSLFTDHIHLDGPGNSSHVSAWLSARAVSNDHADVTSVF